MLTNITTGDLIVNRETDEEYVIIGFDTKGLPIASRVTIITDDVNWEPAKKYVQPAVHNNTTVHISSNQPSRIYQELYHVR